MAYYPDHSEYRYFRIGRRPGSLNVGWLEPGQDFARGTTSECILDKLWDFCKVFTVISRGFHTCEFCPGKTIVTEQRGGAELRLGSAEIRVFSPEGRIFAAPNLIYHDILAHQYLPPDDFLRAVCRGPGPSDPRYFSLLEEYEFEYFKTTGGILELTAEQSACE